MKVISFVVIFFIAPLALIQFQNCAQPGFYISESSVNLESQSSVEEPTSIPTQVKIQYPQFNLMSGNQVYQTFLTLTGQVGETSNQRDEFNQRKSSFSDQGEVQAINAPYLLAATSLAGTSCNELVQKERNQLDQERSIFKGINFTLGVSQISDQVYLEIANRLALGFWNMNLDQSEREALIQFKNAFTQGLPDNATETDKLLVSTCSAILSNIRVLAL